jgi:signal transduction histidine kinase
MEGATVRADETLPKRAQKDGPATIGFFQDITERKQTEDALRQVKIAITDTGPGIPPENLDKIFEPFFTTRPSGTGLGLAISFDIVQNHAGRITVENQPGAGATFTVCLPAL